MKHHIPIERTRADSKERAVPIRHKGATVLGAIFWTLLVLSSGAYAVWYFAEYKKSGLASVGIMTSNSSTDDYLAAIARKILLPKDNTAPRVAVITDPHTLVNEQEFYRGAEAGDILVVFEESKRAILYSPRRDIIVNVGPVIPRSLSVNAEKPEILEDDIGLQ
ncbi:MAG TPA: hypothetical protein VJ579_00465 [Candidatus Paceibacterota bacterium]|nr:hypothetical protein [Candidatus Paceibacterota bacterium]